MSPRHIAAALSLLLAACGRAAPPDTVGGATADTSPATAESASLPRPTRKETPMAPAAALARHLAEARPGMQFAPERLPVEISGWTFFRAARPDEADGGDEFFVVRADGTVVAQSERAAELAEVLDAGGLASGGDPVALAWATLALTTHEEQLLGPEQIPHLPFAPQDATVEPPRITRPGDTPTLTLWSRRQGARPELIRRTVRLRAGAAEVDTDYPPLEPRRR